MGTRPVARSLVASSIDVITANQAPTGAYVAAPEYDTYRYSWLRDGSFIAAAMDAHGRHESAAAFHHWVARTVERFAYKVELLEERADEALAGTGDTLRPIGDEFTMHTRFTIDGEEAGERWGDFQLDGYGFWLTGVSDHLSTTHQDPAPYTRAIDVVQRYLTSLWQLPCFDSWEEYPARRHMTTWAAIAKGLQSSFDAVGGSTTTTATRIMGRLESLIEPANILRKFVPHAEPATTDGLSAHDPLAGPAVAGHERVGRDLGDDAIDGSALLVIGDMGPFPPDSAVGRATLDAVVETLVVDGGVHRYLGDEFYGGGLWVVLAGALAAGLAATDAARSRDVLHWIESTANAKGHLPEQVETHLLEPQQRAAWVERWGPAARPLLWSHAMYLIASAKVRPMG